MAASKRQFPLDALRTDGWFERIGEGIGSFQALCEIVGERFFAFSIIVGARRWDRASPGDKWVESSQTPLSQPSPQWTYAANAHVLAQTPKSTTVSFVDPTIPAYFTVVIDPATLRLRVLHMTAAAHFMSDRYTRFNHPRAIFPPR